MLESDGGKVVFALAESEAFGPLRSYFSGPQSSLEGAQGETAFLFSHSRKEVVFRSISRIN